MKEGAAVTECALNPKNGLPSYKFVKAGNGYYRIEAASGLVLTVEGDGMNAKVVLKNWKNEPQQLWKLLPKPDAFTG